MSTSMPPFQCTAQQYSDRYVIIIFAGGNGILFRQHSKFFDAIGLVISVAELRIFAF